MGILDSLVKHFSLQATINFKTKLSDSAYHIQMQDEKIKDMAFLPGYFLRLGIGIGNNDTSFKDKIRSYSIWNIDRLTGTIDLAIATQSNGVGAKWAESCKVGGTYSFVLKKGNFLIDNTADSYLMIGDLSSLSHLYMINRNLSADKKVEGIIYSRNKSDLYADIDGSIPFAFHEMPQNPYEELIEKIKEATGNLSGKKMIYIAGDSRICIALNEHFKKKLGYGTKQIRVKPFWNPEKKGLE